MTNRDMVVAIALDWTGKAQLDAPDANGVEWTAAGENASHTFYLGVDAQDRLWAKAGSVGIPEDAPGRPEAPPRGASEAELDAWLTADYAWQRKHEVWTESEPRVVPAGGQAWLGRGAYVVAH